MKTKNMDMLNGSLWNKILMFALPLAASSMLQQLFNSADIAVVGRFCGDTALAAVGSNGPIINLLINLFVGLSVGSNVVIARYIGQQRKNKISDGVHTAISLALISGIFLTVLGLIVTRPMLEMMSTPDDIIDLSSLYLKIYFLGMPFIMLYNFGSAVLRSRGDTKRPFICLVTAGIINVIFNLIFVIVFGMSVDGVGYATLISNIISSGMIIYFLMHEDGDMKLEPKKLKLHLDVLKEMAKIGIPAGLQSMVFSASNICVQSAMNSLGSTYVAASSAAVNFEFFAYFIINSFSQANVTFTSQNYGAGKFKRCTKVAMLSVGLGAIFTMLLCSIFMIFGKTLLQIYTTDPVIIDFAYQRMKFVMTFQFVNAFLEVTSGGIRGLGYSFIPAIISVVGVCGTRLLWVYTVFAEKREFMTLIAVYPISWGITAAAVLISYFIIKKRAYRKIEN